MEIAKQMAGFEPAEADDLRKAVGKKNRELMAEMEPKFLQGLEVSGTEARVARDLWSLMTAAAVGNLALQGTVQLVRLPTQHLVRQILSPHRLERLYRLQRVGEAGEQGDQKLCLSAPCLLGHP